jgi:hypothetical protein
MKRNEKLTRGFLPLLIPSPVAADQFHEPGCADFLPNSDQAVGDELSAALEHAEDFSATARPSRDQ